MGEADGIRRGEAEEHMPLTEIVKIDPTFEREKFLKECESDIIPNVLEAITRGDLEILEDWWVYLTLCHCCIAPTL